MPNECTTCCNRGCQSCQSCDDGCQGTCDTKQTLCRIGKENSNNSFSYSTCVSKGQVITPIGEGGFDRNVWNEGIKMINTVRQHGRIKYPNIPLCTSDTFITASEFNRVAEYADYSTTVGKNTLIYGSYYEGLESAISNLKYKQDQCEECDQECDVDCDSCQSCDGGCNGCDSECGNYCCDCCDNNCCDNDTEEES